MGWKAAREFDCSGEFAVTFGESFLVVEVCGGVGILDVELDVGDFRVEGEMLLLLRGQGYSTAITS